MKHNYTRMIKDLNRARAQYNPLRSLTFQRAVSLLERGELGEYADLQWLYRMIEKRDAVLGAIKRRRSASLVKLGHDIKQTPADLLPKGATEEMAEAQVAALRELYDGIDNLKDAISFLALATFRGYSHLEKAWNGRNSVDPQRIDALMPIEQWYWTRDGIQGDWMFDPELRQSIHQAEAVDFKGLVIREVEDPVNEIGLICYLRKNLSQKDWDGFVEVFGIPDIFFTMPQGLSKEEQEKWMATATMLAGDGTGTLPYGADVKAVGGDVRGTNPFKEHLQYQDEMMVLAGTGGKLTMLSDATGIGSGATDAHEAAFDELAQAEAAEISELLQRSIDKPFLDARFPGQPHLAYFEIAAKDEEDITALANNAVKFKQAGFDMDADDLSERTGYQLRPAPGAEGMELGVEVGGASAVRNRRSFTWWPIFRNRKSKDEKGQDKLRAAAVRSVAAGAADDLAPAVDRLLQILDEVDDDQLLEAAEHFLEVELPAISEEILGGPSAAADALAGALNANLFNGMAQRAESMGK